MASFESFPSASFTVADQHLIYQAETATAIDASFRFVYTVYENSIAASNLLGKFYLTPNPEEYAFFNLSEVVRDLCVVDVKEYNSNNLIHSFASNYFTRSNNNIKKFIVGIGEWNGTTETIDQETQTIHLIDGHFQISDGFEPSFVDYYGTASGRTFWLTNRRDVSQTITIDADRDDQGVVAFLNRSTISQVVKLQVKVYNSSDTLLDTIDIDVNTANGAQLPSASTPTKGFLCYFGIYPGNIAEIDNIFDYNPTWAYYEVTPLSSTPSQTGNTIRINKKCTPAKQDSVQLGWTNSVGGWDYLRFDGKKQKTVSREEKTYRKLIGDYAGNAFTFQDFDREITPYQLEAKETYQLNSLLTIEEVTLLQYCMRSKNVMLRLPFDSKLTSGWVPVTIQTNSMQIEEETVSKVFITSFNVELAQIIRC